MVKPIKIVLGGVCHWCTEAVFQALKGVEKVEQGYVASIEENKSFSEFKTSRGAIELLLKKSKKPFCKRFTNLKLKLILDKFSNQVHRDFIITI